VNTIRIPSKWLEFPQEERELTDTEQEQLEEYYSQLQEQEDRERIDAGWYLDRVRSDYYPHMDPDYFRVLAASYLANHNHLNLLPLWLVVIGASSGGKTEALKALSRAVAGKWQGSVTSKTFISHSKAGTGNNSLLHRLGDRQLLAIPDFSELLAKQKNERNEILAQLRMIYDGQYSRSTGMGQSDCEDWSGHITVIAAATPIVSLFQTLHNQLGERFIHLRLSAVGEKDQEELAMQVLAGNFNPDFANKRLELAFCNTIHEAATRIAEVHLEQDTQRRIAALIQFTALARTGVIRDRNTKKVVLPPTPENVPRLGQQLKALALALIAIRGTKTLGPDDYLIVERIALDSIPEPAGAILWSVYEGLTKASEIARRVRLSIDAVKLHLEDLGLLELIEVTSGPTHANPTAPLSYAPSDRGLSLLGKARYEEA
jgi:hypothetical protein